MKLDFYDKIALLFYFEIVGFVCIFYLVSDFIPLHNTWEFYLATLILAVSLSYISIKIIISIIENYLKNKNETKKNI